MLVLDIIAILVSLDFLIGVSMGIALGLLGYRLGLRFARLAARSPITWIRRQAEKAPQRMRLAVALAGAAALLNAPYSLAPRLAVGLGVGTLLAAGLLINPQPGSRPSGDT